MLYGLDRIGVDEYVVIPCMDESPRLVCARLRAYSSKLAERTNLDFKVDRVPLGIRVTRLQ